MNTKPLLGIGVSTAATVSTVPVILASNGGNEKTNIVKPEIQIHIPKAPVWASKLIGKISTTQDVKSKYKDINCLKKYKGDDSGWSTKEETNDNPQFTLDNKIESCLMIEHYSQELQALEWSGEFKLVWSLGNESEALVISFDAITNKGKLSMNASVYILAKEGEKWVISHQKEDFKKETNSNEEVSKLFPEKGDAINFRNDSERWGWNRELEKICRGSACTKNPTSSSVWGSEIWESKEDNEGEIHKWNKDFGTWFDSLFSGWTNIKNKILSVKGIWTKKQ